MRFDRHRRTWRERRGRIISLAASPTQQNGTSMRSQLLMSLVALSACGVLTGRAQLVNKEPLAPLMKASAKGDLQTVKHLLESGVDVRQRTKDGQIALYEAI